jgi:serine/threonine protein kinase
MENWNGHLTKHRELGRGTYGIVYGASFRPDDQKYQPFPEQQSNEVAVKRHIVDKTASFIVPVRELSLLNHVRDHPFFVKLKTVSFGNPFKRRILNGNREILADQSLSPIEDRTLREDELFFIFEKASYDLHTLIYSKSYSVQQMKRSMVQVLLGIEYIHGKNIIHRDLKPSNLLWFQEGDHSSLKICDLGLSKYMTNQQPMTPRTVTSWYRAPEIVCGERNYSYPIDIWSVGCIFVEMLTRKALFYRVADDNAMIAQRMVDTLPTDQVGRMIEMSNSRFRLRRPNHRGSPKTWESIIGYTSEKINDFNRFDITGNDNYDSLMNLLVQLLEPSTSRRCTATEALNHKFFDFDRDYIDSIRELHPPVPDDELDIRIIDCPTRREVTNLAFIVFNKRDRFRRWYKHRILFQSIDMFDRYLLWLKSNGHKLQMSSNEIYLRFMVCLYLAMKLLTTTRIIITFRDMFDSKFEIFDGTFWQPEYLEFAHQFERELMQTVLKFQIYRPTVLEAADFYGIRITDSKVKDLLVSYGTSSSATASIRTLFAHYSFGQPLPLPSPSTVPSPLSSSNSPPLSNESLECSKYLQTSTQRTTSSELNSYQSSNSSSKSDSHTCENSYDTDRKSTPSPYRPHQVSPIRSPNSPFIIESKREPEYLGNSKQQDTNCQRSNNERSEMNYRDSHNERSCGSRKSEERLNESEKSRKSRKGRYKESERWRRNRENTDCETPIQSRRPEDYDPHLVRPIINNDDSSRYSGGIDTDRNREYSKRPTISHTKCNNRRHGTDGSVYNHIHRDRSFGYGGTRYQVDMPSLVQIRQVRLDESGHYRIPITMYH